MNSSTEIQNHDTTAEPLLPQAPSELSLEQLDEVQGGFAPLIFLAGVGVGIVIGKLF